MSRECGVPVANVFHAGDGNLHPLIMYDGKIPGAFDKANDFAHSILRLCIEMGGSITGEHGVGIEKRGVFAEMFDEPTIDLMHRVRAEMDPH
ncbi:MAG: FAD-linked oxidase C-terminal domain-containing protein, partial [Spirochaetales bacterium]|nr:FAD-linked oxidase C-terminal domain-containing protein [Spirochaetales bacterium]